MLKRDYPKIKIKYVPTINDALETVSMGKADAFIGNLAVVSHYISKYGYTNIKIAAPTSYNKTQFGFGIRKDWPEFLNIVQKVLNNISTEQHNQIKLD